MFANTFKRRRNTVIATLVTIVIAIYVAVLFLRLLVTYCDDVVWLGIVTGVVLLVVLAMGGYVIKSGKEDFEYTIKVSDDGITFVLYKWNIRKEKCNKPDRIFIRRPFDVRISRKTIQVSDGNTTLALPYTKKSAQYIINWKDVPKPCEVKVYKGVELRVI